MRVERLECDVAQSASGPVDDALEGEVIVGLGDKTQIGIGVANFGAFIKARAADNPVGDAEIEKAVFKFAHLERGAHQNGHLVQLVFLAAQLFDFLSNSAGFFFAIPIGGDFDLLAVIAVSPERLAEALLVGGDEAGGRAENMRGRAVVAFEFDDLRAGKVFLKAQDVVDFRAAPAVDRLVIVADATDVATLLCEQPQPQILRDVGVLIFVHQHIFEAFLIFGEDFGMLLKDAQSFEQQIAEIDRVQNFQPRLIGCIEFATFAIGKIMRFACWHFVGCQAAVFPTVDVTGELSCGPAFFVEVFRFDKLLEQADLIVGVEDGEVGAQTGEFRVAAQHLRADGVEGAEPLHAFDHTADEATDAVFHFACGFVGEGHGEDFTRPGAFGGQQMREPRCQHACFARARTGEHKNGTIKRFDSFALRVVQSVEIGRMHARESGSTCRAGGLLFGNGT